MSEARPEAGLFVTCLVDLFRPSVGFAAVALLEQAGCAVTVPRNQTCCGQPAYNGGDRTNAKAIAKQVIEAFESFDYVVAPSGSCAGMIAKHYPQLFADDPAMAARARDLAGRTHELISFLVDIRDMRGLGVKFDATATYHDSCSGLRELNVKAQPRALLEQIEGLRLVELPGAELCCGFGGAFCVKYPEISNRMAANKTRDIAGTGADLVLAGDLGCLMNIAGKLAREGSSIRVRHIAEVLAGTADQPAIGEGPR
jgi:L-lactate dehydrogenase complex protein LldE